MEEYNRSHDDFPISILLGMATAGRQGVSLSNTFKRADDLMYRNTLYRSESARSQIVQALLATLAERDYITEGHAQRLSELFLEVV